MRRLPARRRGHRLEARTALIIGALRGLGSATARALAARGALVLADRDLPAVARPLIPGGAP